MARRTKRRNPWTEEGWVEGEEDEDEWPDKPPSELTEEEMEAIKEKLLLYSKGTEHESMAQTLFGNYGKRETEENIVPGIKRAIQEAAEAIADDDLQAANDSLSFLANYLYMLGDSNFTHLVQSKDFRDHMLMIQDEILDEAREMQDLGPTLRAEEEEHKAKREYFGSQYLTREQEREWERMKEEEEGDE